MARSTIGGILRQLGRGRLAAPEPRPPVVRHQRERPGELIHIDTKGLGRIAAVSISWSERHASPSAALPGNQKAPEACWLISTAMPIAALERLFPALPQAPQEGASPISAASSSAVTARDEAGGASSPGAGS